MGSRRTRGEGSIYQRASDGRWIGVVDMGYVDGKRLRKTASAPTLKELRPKFRALVAQLDAGVDDENLTVEQWMNRWLEDVASERNKPSTLRTYRTYTDRWIIGHLGKTRLSKLRPDHVRRLNAAMKQAGLKDSSRRQVYAILKRALKVAENDGLISSNPASKVDAPPVGQGSHGKFTLAEAKTILAGIAEREDRARWICALLAGLRQGEALGLRWDDVDLDRGLIRVDRAAQRIKGQGVQIVDLKSAASHRMVPMVEPVHFALSQQPRDYFYVFGTDKPADPRRDWQRWRDMLDAVGVERRPLHAARATTASLLNEAGVSPKIISEIMGHSQTQVTDRHYIHGDSVMHRTAMDGLNTLLGS